MFCKKPQTSSYVLPLSVKHSYFVWTVTQNHTLLAKMQKWFSWWNINSESLSWTFYKAFALHKILPFLKKNSLISWGTTNNVLKTVWDEFVFSSLHEWILGLLSVDHLLRERRRTPPYWTLFISLILTNIDGLKNSHELKKKTHFKKQIDLYKLNQCNVMHSD